MLNQYYRVINIVLGAFILTGCASVTSGPTQKITVDSGSDCGSMCTLKNDKGLWTAQASEKVVTVNRSAEDLTVECTNGHKSGTASVKSSMGGNVFGNALLPGGLVATAIDCQNGSAYEYPEVVKVALK